MIELPPIDGYIERSDDESLWRDFVGDQNFSPLRLAIVALSARPEIRRVLLPIGEEALPAWLGKHEKLEIVARQNAPAIAAQAAMDALIPFMPPTSTFGPALLSEFCTFTNAARVLDAVEASKPCKLGMVMVVSNSTAFLTDGAIEIVLSQAVRRGFAEAAYTAEGPRGLFPILWAPVGLQECAQLNVSLQAVFWKISGVFGQVLGHSPSAVKRLRRSLSLREPRSKAFANSVVASLRSADAKRQLDDVDLIELCEHAAALAHDFRGRMPKDLEIEICSDRPLPAPYLPAPTAAGTCMSVRDFAQIIAEIEPEDGVNLTLGGFGDPLLHPELDAILAAARPKFAAIALKTFKLASADVFQHLGAQGVAIVQWRMGAWQEAWRAINGLAADADFEAFAQPAVDIRAALGDGIFTQPMLIPEVTKCFEGDKTLLDFYAFCKEAKFQPLVSSMATFGGAIKSDQAIVPAPAERKACFRLEEQMLVLADGGVLACSQMAGANERIGNALQTRLSELWNGETLSTMLEHQRGGAYAKAHRHCEGCSEWCRLT